MKKKLVVGITAPQSEYLLRGQLKYFSQFYQVYLLAPDAERVRILCEKEGAIHLPISIQREIKPFHDVRTLIQIIRIFYRVKPDIVNLGTPKVSLLGMMAAWLMRVPVRIYTCRGFRYEHESGRLKKMLITFERFISWASHKVVCISKSVQELGIRDAVFDEKKSCVIGFGSSNGVDLELFNPTGVREAERVSLQQELKLNSVFTLGYVGRLVDRKGISELYEAFNRLYEKHSHIRLLVVGRPYFDQIKDKSLMYAFSKHPGIVMVGLQPLERIPLYLSIMDLFVLPAYWEGFGNVLIQAAAMGLPVLSTNVTGCKDAVRHEFNGLLVEGKSVVALEEGIEFLMNNPRILETYGSNGLVWAKNFDPILVWEGLHSLIETLSHGTSIHSVR